MSNERLRQVATGSAAVAKKTENPVVKFSGFLEKLKPQIAAALPKHLNADRMARLALTAFSSNKDLQACSANSIAASIMTAAQLGLEPGVNGQAYLIPYRGTCTFVPGWKGLVDLVSRAGRASVWTGAVFEGDAFDYELGDSPFVRHKPMGEDDPAKLTHVYAVGRVNNAPLPVIDVWPMAKVIRHRDRFNKVGTKHYSFAHPEMYARKIVLLQVLKYMPQSVEMSMAIDADERAGIDASTFDMDTGPAPLTADEIERQMRDAQTSDDFEAAAAQIPTVIDGEEQSRLQSIATQIREVYAQMNAQGNPGVEPGAE